MSLPLGTIHQTDCVKALAKLAPGSIDLAFADPPFNIGYEYDEYDDRKERDAYLDWSKAWISGVHAALKPTGTFWLAIGDEYAAELKLLSQEIGFSCRSWVVWYYTFGVNCTRKFTRSHAHLFHFVKHPKKFTFNWADPANRVPSARQLVYADTRANPFGRLPDDTWILRPQNMVDGFTPEEDTWYIPRVNGTFKERAGFHGCQMPEQLLGRIIRCCSDAGEIVLDPFSGSATTLVVAKKLGRQWIGFELSKEYVKRGRKRIESVRSGDVLEGPPEPCISAPATPIDKPAEGKPNPESTGTTKPRHKGLQASAPSDTSEKHRSGKSSRSVPLVRDRQVATLVDMEKGLIDAFQATAKGFSVDRVVADPELNAAFLDKAQRLGLADSPAFLNRSLFGLRKAGKLVSIPTTRRTEFGKQDIDSFVFASEIAWRQMFDELGQSLDEIFCDPSHAARFDHIATGLAPGFSPLQYRWAALKLRKESKKAREYADELSTIFKKEKRSITSLDFDEWRGIRGAYLISNRSRQRLYAGEALDLGSRLQCKFGGSQLKIWQGHGLNENIEIYRHGESEVTRYYVHQCRLIRQFEPRLNHLPDAA